MLIILGNAIICRIFFFKLKLCLMHLNKYKKYINFTKNLFNILFFYLLAAPQILLFWNHQQKGDKSHGIQEVKSEHAVYHQIPLPKIIKMNWNWPSIIFKKQTVKRCSKTWLQWTHNKFMLTVEVNLLNFNFTINWLHITCYVNNDSRSLVPGASL